MSNPLRATILGDGGWGTALALVLHRNGADVTVWGIIPPTSRAWWRRAATSFLPGVDLPPEIAWTSDCARAADRADLIVVAIPSRFYRDTLGRFRGIIGGKQTVVSVSKGLREDRRLSEIAEEVLGHPAVAALSGPSHAEEVARGIPTAVVAACREPARATSVQQAFNGSGFRVYTSDDVIGVEVGGAIKNVIAIAAGACDGIGFGDNTKAALMTRGLVEIARLGASLGAKPATFYGLSGMGDLIVTCGGRRSRNRSVGERIGQGETLDRIQASMQMIAEGVPNAITAQALARHRGVDTPIIDEVNRVLYEGKSPRQALIDLLSRDPKPE
ncbi:MAG: NAD(P)H-dependent glycerol-3-phosphate dehydrogenase [Kiritimatiellia bacterium]